MQTYLLSQLTEETLNTLVELHEQDGPIEVWGKMQIPLTAEEGMMLDYLKADVQQRHFTRLIESERPVFHVEFSPRYSGTLEVERIVQLLISSQNDCKW